MGYVNPLEGIILKWMIWGENPLFVGFPPFHGDHGLHGGPDLCGQCRSFALLRSLAAVEYRILLSRDETYHTAVGDLATDLGRLVKDKMRDELVV